jgi:hypothetical protein
VLGHMQSWHLCDTSINSTPHHCSSRRLETYCSTVTAQLYGMPGKEAMFF